MTTTPDYKPEHAELALPPILWKDLLLNPMDSAVKCFVLINKINELDQDIIIYEEDPDNYEVEIERYKSQLELQKSILERYPQGIREIFSLGENLKRYPALFFYPARYIYVAGSVVALAAVYAFRAFMNFNIYVLKDMTLNYFIDLFTGDLYNESVLNREDDLFPAAKAKYLNEVRLSDINFIDIDDNDELILAMQRRDNEEGWVTSEEYEFDEVDEKIREPLTPHGYAYLRLVGDAIRPIIFQPLPSEKYAKAMAIALWPCKFFGGILLMGLAVILEGMYQLTRIAVLGLSFLAAAATASILSFVNLPLFLWDAPAFCREKYNEYKEKKISEKTVDMNPHESTYTKLLSSELSFTGHPQKAASNPVPAMADSTSTPTHYSFLQPPKPETAMQEKAAAVREKRVTLVV